MTEDAQFSLWRHRQYMCYWTTRFSTSLAYQMLFVAVGWQVYELTNSALDLGLIGLVLFLPSVPGTLLVGHVSDHYDRRWVVRAAQVGKAISAGALAIGTLTGSLTAIVIFSAVLLMGFCRAFDNPTLHTLVPGIVPKEMFSRAIAAGASANQVATISGPAVGGFIYGFFGPAAVYEICFSAFVLAGVLVGFLRLKYPPHEKKPMTLATVFAGFIHLHDNRIILGAVLLDFCVITLAGVLALLPIFARDILHTGPEGLGILRAAPAVGALIATVLLTHATLTRNSGKFVICALGIYGFTVLVFGFSTWLPLSVAALMVYGAMDIINGVIRQSMIQARTPNEKLGRVMSVSNMITSSANTLGQFESGVMAALLGVVPSVLIGGAAGVVVAILWIKIFPELWRVQSVVPDEEEVAARAAIPSR